MPLDMNEKTWRRIYDSYEISSDGYLRTYAHHRLIVPDLLKAGRNPGYRVTIDGARQRRAITGMIASVFDTHTVVTMEMGQQIYNEADAYNERKGLSLKYQRHLERVAAAERAANAAADKKVKSITLPPASSDCVFPHLTTLVTGYGSFDDPQIDPMSCGTWWVRLPEGLEPVAVERAA
jgi:hypothetical protein